jgi:hypothetical protein
MQSREELKILCESLKGKVNSFSNPSLTRALQLARGALRSTLASDSEIREHLTSIKQHCKA